MYGYMVLSVVLPILCFPDGKYNRWNETPAHRPRNNTSYDIPLISFVFQIIQKEVRSSLMMAGYYRNM
jgi:hypothetical protein